MAIIPAIGAAPVSFVDGAGNQRFIPLNFISYASAAGAPTATSWPGWAGLSTQARKDLNAWLAALGAEGLLTREPAPAIGPAFTITSVSPGSTANDIKVAFTSRNPDGSLNVTVSTVQPYKGLTFVAAKPNSVDAVLGTSPGAGAQPGLAYVSAAPTSAPKATSGAVAFAIPKSGTDFQFALPGCDGVLTASSPTDPDSALITATVAITAAGEFDLTLSWSKTATNVTPATLEAKFGYLIKVSPPAGGFGPTPATPSVVTLAGGADPSSTSPAFAAATVISG